MPEIEPTDIAALREALEKCKTRTNESWMTSLRSRKLEEAQFHDAQANDIDRQQDKGRQDGNLKYYSVTEHSNDYIRNWLRENVPGKVFLDYACGEGEAAVDAAKLGAALSIGMDISRGRLVLATQSAQEAGVGDKTVFLQGDCENTGLPENSIDVILCSGMLHHLDLSYAFPELRRILKPGGVVLAAEALGYNPLIQLYRMLTPKLRTDWEKRHILRLRDVRFARRFFNVRNVRYWHLFSLLAVPWRRTPLFRAALTIGNAFDRVALRIPPICYMAWQFTFEMVKRGDE